MTRPHEIALLGATGFVGRLTAHVLAERAASLPLSVVLAGRSLERLHALKAELSASCPAAQHFEVHEVNTDDQAGLRRLAANAHVVATTVGPYTHHGEAVVAACVEEGTHACDLTGEVLWMRRMIETYHEEARRRGVRIVCGAGFDSVPSDMGVLFLQDEAVRRCGTPCDRVRLFVTRSRGGVSGGTVASAIATLDETREPQNRAALFDPYALNPMGERTGADGRDDLRVRFDEDLRAWTAPFVMGPVNTRVVRRTHALLGSPWGPDFTYQERMSTGAGLRGRMRAVAVAAALGAGLGALQVRPLRALLERTLLPAPGEGPHPDVIRHGFFDIELVGRFTHAPDRAPVRVHVHGTGDPGYGFTSSVLADIAIALARRADALPPAAGILTPAVALGLDAVPWLAPALTMRVL